MKCTSTTFYQKKGYDSTKLGQSKREYNSSAKTEGVIFNLATLKRCYTFMFQFQFKSVQS